MGKYFEPYDRRPCKRYSDPMDGPAWDMTENELAMDALKKFLDSTR